MTASDGRTPRGRDDRGLTAAELEAALAALADELDGHEVVDTAPLQACDGNDDLLLVLAPATPPGPKRFLHVALGGTRGRVTLTARRFGAKARVRGPGPDTLQRELDRARLLAVEASPGERRAAFRFATAASERRLVVELFGARGLWALCDADGTCLSMSRPIETAVRTLRRGDHYRPPPPTPKRRADPPPRFPGADILAAIDSHFTERDQRREHGAEIDGLQVHAARALKRAEHRCQGLQRQLEAVDQVTALRARADLMLAYAHIAERGATELRVPSLDGDGETILELDPKLPVTTQANNLYERARRLVDGRAISQRRHDEAIAERASLQQVLAQLDAIASATDDRDDVALDAIHKQLSELGALPAPRRDESRHRRAGGGRAHPSAVPFRRFTSAEGYAIFVGRNNRQNDDLTMRFANGNDVWLHVGGGRAGSHVVIRLPRQKTASLETLLDAATLAVHFSKARGESRVEVIYTFRKHVRKPKGLPPGAVVPAEVKGLVVTTDAARLRRVLESAGESD